jgi:hypothetical protein
MAQASRIFWDNDSEVLEAWRGESTYLEGDSPGVDLLMFSECARKLKRTLFVVFSHFDRIFKYMSGTLLARMRDLEQNAKLLSCVNISPSPYEELYQIRAKREPGFTSDYGQVHVQLTQGRLQREEAGEIWQRETGLSLDQRLAAQYFGIAYAESGGFPDAFLRATKEILQPNELDKDIRNYKSILQKCLPACFERLLRHLEDNGEGRITTALMRLFLGCPNDADLITLKEHRWTRLFLDPVSPQPLLSCDALGRKALEMSQGLRAKQLSPEELYNQGQFASCLALLRTRKSPHKILPLAAEMMDEVYKNSPQDLYFQQDINWKKVRRLAHSAADGCPNQISRNEFENWARVATIYLEWPSETRHDIEKHLEKLRNSGRPAVEEACIRLGIRLLAIQRDRNLITAAYASIPLVEDLLRHYLVLVLGLPQSGAAYDGIEEENITTWWPRRDTFIRPASSDRLNATAIGVLAALESAQRNQRLFDQPEDLHKTLTDLENARNPLGHHVLTPSQKVVTALLTHATNIFHNMCIHANSTLSLDAISEMVCLPRRFLNL